MGSDWDLYGASANATRLLLIIEAAVYSIVC